jgi:2-oxoglutarate ferredoxin oxidoreductase subunit delta
MSRIVIDKDRCKACELCIDVCNKGLLALAEELNLKGYHPIAIRDMESCTACGLCALVCPEGSIAVYKELKLKKAG